MNYSKCQSKYTIGKHKTIFMPLATTIQFMCENINFGNMK